MIRNTLNSNHREILDTHQKALEVNLDPRRYGTFAEIGAGQEVVRWFFRVGGAAGTIAKSMSAYDMKVSDAIYGRASRYVCRERLEAMLDYEHKLNIDRLKDQRGDTTTFFTFADTVSARNFHGTNACHGWIGIKFQAHPQDDDSQIILHVRMLDDEAALQQEALGIVGVNLIHGAFALHHEPDLLLASLLDGLSTSRIEIDMIEFSGIAFRHIDNRLMSLRLVELGLSGAAMFAADGTVLQPSEFFYRKAILVERGSFRPVCNVNLDMLRCAHDKFSKLPSVVGKEVAQVMELTMNNLKAEGEINLNDFLARADVMSECGMPVLISDYFRYFRLAAYLSSLTNESIAITMGAGSVQELFDEQYYKSLDGGILESFGRLFKNDLKVYCYPMMDSKTGELMTCQNMQVEPTLKQLFGYLYDRGCIQDVENFDPECLKIRSREVLKKIKTGDMSWETMVPEKVAAVIKRKRYFDHNPEFETAEY
ncbi:nicotinate-nucleotide adenylyltransferase [Rhodopirellula sp. MGV]|uniref:nicotinate-nucleotide adenylyltransferase n=1 Tax=Rhodopirellula sp. MGV TaxID=2023130 RepID=UPI000B9719D9|nr:nicotinate-nucleotide adenylyltransferase [Rhodopirellula sp. MGV]OYP34897.1 nicotinate-nucleotide adenylyltransferase [Rhodopirellula sp. MGV]PNY38207.1 nicotinate-nucleotide adenylyltransferase [Rhodopirellula baltica]